MALLEIQGLTLEFPQAHGALRAVEDLSLKIEAGETVGLLGESGSGKSLTALAIARLAPSPSVVYAAGRILIEGRDVLKMTPQEHRRIRGGTVAYVFQEPGASLNPVLRVSAQILESLQLHRPAAANAAEVVRLLGLVGIPAPETTLRSYPHQLSGGMQQRAMLAMALASQPKLLVADEPTTALDVTIQAQIMELLKRLKSELGMAILLITHNLGIVGDLADRIAVMYAGQIVETAPARELLRAPRHPYTRALMRSVPKLGAGLGRLSAIPGSVPQLGEFPTGCRFHPRCPLARLACSEAAPGLAEVAKGWGVRCPWWEEGATRLGGV